MAKTHENIHQIESSGDINTNTLIATHTTYINHKCTKPIETDFGSEHQIESNNQTDEMPQMLR